MERDTSFVPERYSEPGEAQSARRRERGRSPHLWNPFEMIEALLYLFVGLGKLFIRGIFDS